MNLDDLDVYQKCILWLSPGPEAIAAASIGIVSVGSLVKEITRWELLSSSITVLSYSFSTYPVKSCRPEVIQTL